MPSSQRGGAARDVGGRRGEWKGKATYYDLVTEKRIAPKAAWSYLNPSPGFEPIAGAVAVMAALIDRCAVNGEKVLFQDTVVGGPVAFFSSDQTLRPDKLWRVVGSTPGGHHCDGFGLPKVLLQLAHHHSNRSRVGAAIF